MDDYVISLFFYLPEVYRELLEPSLINRVLILKYQFNTICPVDVAIYCLPLIETIKTKRGVMALVPAVTMMDMFQVAPQVSRFWYSGRLLG